MTRHIPLNFEWRLPSLIATGGKPSHPQQLDWLEKQNILAIISLEPIPDEIRELISEDCLSWLEIDLDQYGSDEEFDVNRLPPGVWQKFKDFIDQSLFLERPVYVHCSAGISRSVKMVRRYLQTV